MPANPQDDVMATPLSGPIDPSRYQATAWGSAYVELPVPSGQLCLVQRLSMSALLTDDLVDDFNMLTSLVQTEHVSKKSRGTGKAPGKAKQAELQADAIMRDKGSITRAVRLTDAIVSRVVVQPHIWPVPEKDEKGNLLEPRLPDRVYIDQVVDTDKAFITQWAFGGTRDLARFRDELIETVDGMANVQDLAQTS